MVIFTDAFGTAWAFSSSTNNLNSIGSSTFISPDNPPVNTCNCVCEDAVFMTYDVPLTPFALAWISELPTDPVVIIGNVV